MNQKRSKGFSLLEVLLAVVVVTVAGLGAYALFDSGVKSNNITDAEDEAIQIANVYTDLASSDLTSADDDIPTLLQNSGRLSSKYFSTATGSDSSSVSMYNAFGALNFTPVSAYSFSVQIPLGCLPENSTIPQNFFNKVRDLYNCDGSDTYSTACLVACVAGKSPTYLDLSFSINT